MSGVDFIIQIKVRGAWKTVTRLPNEAALQRLLPPLELELGDFIRGLCGQPDALTGKIRWTGWSLEPTLSGDANVPQTGASNSLFKSLQEMALLERTRRLGSNLSEFLGTSIVLPLRQITESARRHARRLAAIPNKRHKLQIVLRRGSRRVAVWARQSRVQWALCAAGSMAGLTAAFTSSVPGGLSLAVLCCLLLPPLRTLASLRATGSVSSATRGLALASVLLTAVSTEVMTPELRQANAARATFTANRLTILAGAREAVEARDYIGAMEQLAPYAWIEDESLAGLVAIAKPRAAVVRNRQAKISSQFLFNGANRYLTAYIVQTMDDPGSFHHLNTDYQVHDTYLDVLTTYSGLNNTGRFEDKTIRAWLDFDGKILKNDRDLRTHG